MGEPALALSESIGESDPNRDQLASIGPSGAAVTTNPSTRSRLNTYTTYSIGCAGAWGAILLVAQRRLDSQNRSTLRLVCGGWWMGWTSATIARIGFPPPKPLTPAAESRLRVVSIVLVALGLTSTIRFLATGERPHEARRTPEALRPSDTPRAVAPLPRPKPAHRGSAEVERAAAVDVGRELR